MPGILRTSSFTSTAEEFELALAWINSMDIKTDKGRFLECRRYLKLFMDVKSEQEVQSLIKNNLYPQFASSLFEAKQLIAIYRGLSKTRAAGLKPKMNQMVKGTLLPQNETNSSRKARDVAFELRIGAHFGAVGYDVDFSKDADLQIKDENTMLFVECKRATSLNSLKNRIGQAFNQITKRCNKSEYSGSNRGIVALSITELVNPKHFYLLVKNEADLEQKVDKTIVSFANKYNSIWTRELDIRCIGIIIYYQLISIIEDLDLLTPTQYFGWWYLSLPGRSDYVYFDKITKRLTKSIELLTN